MEVLGLVVVPREAAGLPVAEFPQISVQALAERARGGEAVVVDVRREGEWKGGHIKAAKWAPLDTLAKVLENPHPSGAWPPSGIGQSVHTVDWNGVDRHALIAVHCKSGYRSAIACSLLQRAGFTNVVNVVGGFDAWWGAGLPVTTEQAVEV